MSGSSVLVFGGSGVIGAAAASYFHRRGWAVTATGRRVTPPSPASGSSAPVGPSAVSADAVPITVFDPFAPDPDYASLAAGGPYDAVVWAQGANVNDSLYTLDIDRHIELLMANCVFITKTMNALLTRKMVVERGARFCVVSSIWQSIARQNKYSYTVSKAAVQGIVHAASVDLGQDGHLVNAVLPGVVDTPMTRANLSPEQIDAVSSATLFNRLVGLEDVCSTIHWLCSSDNHGVTGQSVAVDLGFRHGRIL